jgi:hypothetical protein
MITIDARAPAYVDLAAGFAHARKMSQQPNVVAVAAQQSDPAAAHHATWLGTLVSQFIGLFQSSRGRGDGEPARAHSLTPLQVWWQRIKVDNQVLVAGAADRTAGSIGERQLLSILGNQLADEYIAVGGALLLRNLDIDVVVIGPTGIWVLESKYWSGDVTVHTGKWTQESGSSAPFVLRNSAKTRARSSL